MCNKHVINRWISSVQSSSVTQLCPTLCDPMNRSTPGLPVHHQLPEFNRQINEQNYMSPQNFVSKVGLIISDWSGYIVYN